MFFVKKWNRKYTLNHLETTKGYLIAIQCAFSDEIFISRLGIFYKAITLLQKYAIYSRSKYFSDRDLTSVREQLHLEIEKNGELRRKCKASGSGMKGIEVDMNQDVEINMQYIIYLQKFGPPENGLFQPELLAQCSP